MLQKLKDLLGTALTKMPSLSNFNLSMDIVFAVAATYALIIILFIAGWLHNWYVKGIADLQMLIALFDKLANSNAVLAFTWLGKAFVDKNKNKIPDSFENDENQTSPFIMNQRRNEVMNNVNQAQSTTGQSDRILPVNKD